MALREALLARNRAVIVENIAIFRTIVERSANIDCNIINQLDDCLRNISFAQDRINTLERIMPAQQPPGDEEDDSPPDVQSKKKK